jgi:hypothetical protein
MELDRGCEEVEEYIGYTEEVEFIFGKEKYRKQYYIIVVIITCTEYIYSERLVTKKYKKTHPYYYIVFHVESRTTEEYDSEEYNKEYTLIIARWKSLKSQK